LFQLKGGGFFHARPELDNFCVNLYKSFEFQDLTLVLIGDNPCIEQERFFLNIKRLLPQGEDLFFPAMIV
jgi:hypothetical protein